LGSNPPKFSLGDELNLLPNPSLNPGDSTGGRLLLLLFPKDRLLLLFPSKASNPPNRFTPMIPKYKKYSLLVFLMLVILFC